LGSHRDDGSLIRILQDPHGMFFQIADEDELVPANQIFDPFDVEFCKTILNENNLIKVMKMSGHIVQSQAGLVVDSDRVD
jgi:hypothetical protein